MWSCCEVQVLSNVQYSCVKVLFYFLCDNDQRWCLSAQMFCRLKLSQQVHIHVSWEHLRSLLIQATEAASGNLSCCFSDYSKFVMRFFFLLKLRISQIQTRRHWEDFSLNVTKLDLYCYCVYFVNRMFGRFSLTLTSRKLLAPRGTRWSSSFVRKLSVALTSFMNNQMTKA